MILNLLRTCLINQLKIVSTRQTTNRTENYGSARIVAEITDVSDEKLTIEIATRAAWLSGWQAGLAICEI